MDNDYEYKHEYERAKYFFSKGTLVHISKSDGAFFNGQITELSEKFFVIKDRFKGNQFISFSELNKAIEPYTEKTEVKK